MSYATAKHLIGQLRTQTNPQQDQKTWLIVQVLDDLLNGLQADISRLEQKLGQIEADVKKKG